MKRVSRERASERRGAEERIPFLSPSLARSREAHFACQNRRACSRAKSSLAVRCRRRLNGPCHAICYPGSLFIIRLYLDIEAVSCFLLEGVGDSCEQQTHFRSTRNASAVRRLGGREKAMSVFKVL